MFLLPKVTESDVQLAAEARQAYEFLVEQTPGFLLGVLKEFYQ